jgi:hypothetical protein
LSATRNGTRCGVSVGTHSTFTPSVAAILLPTSMSKPSQSPPAPRELLGGKFGLMPMRITPSLMMSSSDFAWTVVNEAASAATRARQDKAILLNMLRSPCAAYPEKRAAAYCLTRAFGRPSSRSRPASPRGQY